MPKGADATTNRLSQAIAIGNNALVGCDKCAVIGGTGANAVKVGIGTTTPEARLHIKGGVDATLTAHGYALLGTTANKNIVIDDEIMARNKGNASKLLLQKNGGFIGISTTTPQTKLHIEGRGDWF
ncbi:MAG: hypothetical protein AB8G86_20745 [Saprospiraceae bacterium]